MAEPKDPWGALFDAMFDNVEEVETDAGTVLSMTGGNFDKSLAPHSIRIVKGEPKAFKHITSIKVKDGKD